MSLNILNYRQIQQIKYIVNTVTTQITRLLEVPGIIVDIYEHLGIVVNELSKDQEVDSSVVRYIGFSATYAYLRQNWADFKGSSCRADYFSDLKSWIGGLAKKAIYCINIGITQVILPLSRHRWSSHLSQSASLGIDERAYVQTLITESQRTDTAQEPSLLTGRIYPCTPVSIEFRDVCFSYEVGCNILHSLTLSIQPGQKVAIVGRSGVGKSTIINLLTRLYLADQPTDNPSSGIYLNEKAIESIPLGELRRLITVVPQDNILVRGSATDNIVYGQPRKLLGHHTEEEQRQHIQEVIRLSYEASRIAAAEELLGDTPYSGTLRGLSGGQRQRIGIARAIARGGSVLVLDESTSALDEKTEKRVIKQMFHSLDHNQSVIVITHRLSTLRQVDLIYVLGDPDGSGAHVVESGSYEWFVSESQYLKDMSQDASDDAIIYDRSSVSSTPFLSTTSVGTIDFSLDFRYAQ